MAENLTTQSDIIASVPAGEVIAFDEVTINGTTVKVARDKVGFGVDGSYVDVSSSNPLPIGDAGGSLTVDGTVTANAGTGPWPVTDNGGSLTVDGSVSITGSVAVTDNAGSLTVDNAGTFAVQAAQSGTWNIGSLGTVTNVVHVDDNAGSLTVDGTVGVSGSVAVTDNAGSLTVDAPVGTPVHVRLSDGSSAIATLPVSLASVPSHAVTNAGTFAVQDSEKIADNAGFTDGTTKVLPAGFVYDDVAGTALTENDAAAARIDSKRAQVLVIEDASTRGQRAAVSAAGRLSVDASGVAVPITDNSGSITVDNAGTFAVQAAQSGAWNVTNISGTVSLPTGAATAAKQPALGTAGTPSADVITVQGATSMTALKVDGSAVTQPVSGTVTANLAAGTNAIGKLAANSGVDIGDVDVTSVTPGVAATSLGKAEDAAHTSGDVGVMALAVRNDAGGSLAGTTGDYIPLTTDSSGALRVTGGGGGTQYQEDAAHTTGDTGTMALAVRKDTATALAGTDGDYTPLITDANGALHVAVASGSVTASGTISVDTITTSVVPGTSATHLGKAEDAAHASGDVGVMALAVRKDTAASLAGTDGDYQPPITDSSGRLWVNASGAAIPVTDNAGSLTVDAPVGTPVFVRLSDGASAITALPVTDNSGSITVDNAGTFAVQAASAGDTAHDGADAGNPVKVGFKAANALPTAVANADRANGISDLWGRQLTSHIDPAMQVTKTVTVTTTQTGSDVWSPTSGKRIAITDITVSAYGTTAGRVILWFGDNADTTYSEGTDQVLEKLNFAPSATSKPGFKAVYGNNPVFCTTADRELHLTTDAGISLDITVRGYEW